MAKVKRAYVCSDCGADFPRWQGQCSACAAWNTITEFTVPKTQSQLGSTVRSSVGGYAGAGSAGTKKLSEIEDFEAEKIPTGIGELDRVFGGGITIGSDRKSVV